MTDDERYTAQAQEHLRQYMARQRRQQKTASDAALDALLSAASAFADISQQDIEDARQRAHEYVEARNKNLRPLRVVDPSNEAAVAGQRSALAFVERRRLSKIRK